MYGLESGNEDLSQFSDVIESKQCLFKQMNNKNIAILPYDLITTISNFKINILMKMVRKKYRPQGVEQTRFQCLIIQITEKLLIFSES